MAGIRLTGLAKRFGETAVLDGIDLEVAGGEFVAAYAATNSFHSLTMYSFSSMTAFQQAMPPMRCS